MMFQNMKRFNAERKERNEIRFRILDLRKAVRALNKHLRDPIMEPAA